MGIIPRLFNPLSVARLRRKEIMKNEKLYYRSLDTKIGTIHLVANDHALLVLAFDQNWDRIQKKFPNLIPKASPVIALAQKELKLYLQGKLDVFSVPTELRGTEFQIKVWKALTKIPLGKTASYQEQAIRLKMPRAVRAIARTNGLNPISIFIPCHRVIGKSGKLTGYAGGLHVKEMLLAREGLRISA